MDLGIYMLMQNFQRALFLLFRLFWWFAKIIAKAFWAIIVFLFGWANGKLKEKKEESARRWEAQKETPQSRPLNDNNISEPVYYQPNPAMIERPPVPGNMPPLPGRRFNPVHPAMMNQQIYQQRVQHPTGVRPNNLPPLPRR